MRALLIGGVAAVAVGAFVAGRISGPQPAQAAAVAPKPAAAEQPNRQAEYEAASRAGASAAAAAGDVIAANGGAPTTFTKEGFAKFAAGKTKADIRAALGSPTSVIELSDYTDWRYSNAPVYDADAGTQAAADVMFPKGQDFVDVVRY